jgi:PAS domain S-box-containing protein
MPGVRIEIDDKLRVAFALSPTVLAITTAGEGRLVEVNEAFLRLHGYTRDEVIGRTVGELDLWVDARQRAEALATISAGRPVRDLEVRLRTKTREERVCILNADVLTVDGRACILTALTDITDRVRRDRARDEFLAMLGHELRNPLATIQHAMTLLDRALVGERERHVIDVVHRQTAMLSRLVDDLLDVSRLTSGNVRLAREPVELQALARRCVDALVHGRRGTGHDIHIEGEAVYVDGDRARLEQIVTNLLDNAVKHTPAGGRVTIETRRAGDDAVLVVRDTGAGIAPDLLPRVFDFFVQGPQGLDRAHGGLGLGLAVVKTLVGLHGGTVAAASAGPGRGSEFTIRVPTAPAPAEAAGTAPEAAGDAAPSRRRVLVVEDNADAREMLRILLESDGHAVQTAADGTEGLAALRAFRPDVALVDVGLPGIDGYTLARMAREDAETRAIRLVALTGYGQTEDRARALAAGFDRHVTKPVDPALLEQLVQEG